MAIVPDDTPPIVGWVPTQPYRGEPLMRALSLAATEVGDPVLAVLTTEYEDIWILLGGEVYAQVTPNEEDESLFNRRILINPVSVETLWEALESEGYLEVDRAALF